MMSKSAGILGFGLALMMQLQPANAQATRTWVSGVGDDANPCSRTAPCKTFAGAISKTAAGGQINCIDPGGFGAVTITKSIAIQCDNTEAGILVSGTNGIIVNAAATDSIYLSGLDFQGLGTGLSGINFLNGKELHVNNVVIRRFVNAGITFAPGNATASLTVRNSTIADNVTSDGNGGGGILVKPGAGFNANVTLSKVQLNGNLYGVRAEDRSKVVVVDSVASSNAKNGFLAVSVSAPTEVNVINSVAALNLGNAGFSANGAGATVRMLGSTTIGNSIGLSNTGATIVGTSPDTNLNVGNGTPGAPTIDATLQ